MSLQEVVIRSTVCPFTQDEMEKESLAQMRKAFDEAIHAKCGPPVTPDDL